MCVQWNVSSRKTMPKNESQPVFLVVMETWRLLEGWNTQKKHKVAAWFRSLMWAKCFMSSRTSALLKWLLDQCNLCEWVCSSMCAAGHTFRENVVCVYEVNLWPSVPSESSVFLQAVSCLQSYWTVLHYRDTQLKPRSAWNLQPFPVQRHLNL